MRKIVKSFQIFLSLFLIVFFVSKVQADNPRRYYDWSSTLDTNPNSQVLGTTSDSTASSSAKTKDSTPTQFKYLFGESLTPNSLFYFVKPLQENLVQTFTFDKVKSEELRVARAGERLEEINKMVDEGKYTNVSSTGLDYRNLINKVTDDVEQLKSDSVNVSSLLTKLDEETAKHTIILEKNAAKLPSESKSDIQTAIDASQKGIDKVADLSGRPAVPQEVVDRIQALKAQGILTSEEATKLINSKNRTEARVELKKFVTEGIVPEADFLRMNENVKNFYPDEFYKIHELKRFYELKDLETKKPNESTLTKIQDFAKTFKQGDIVPADIRKYWGPIIRKEELDNTFRPDLIDPNLIKSNPQDFKTFNDVIERYKPRPEDLAFLNNYLKKNPDTTNLPPEYERMRRLGEQYGAQCGAGTKWVTTTGLTSGGYCIKEGQENIQIADQTENKTCRGNMVAAKGPGGACSVFPVDCLPTGFSRTQTCTEIPSQSQLTGESRKIISCPSNSHFVPVIYSADGGYCVPNYTAASQDTSTGENQNYCNAGYHRNYSGGTCLPDQRGGSDFSLSPLVSTPGNYPNPIYKSNSASCNLGSHWVPEPINPQGGYCVGGSNYGDGTTGAGGTAGNGGPGRESQEAACRSGGGTCTGWYNGACSCEHSGGDGTCKMSPAGCGQNMTWDGGSCSCRGGGSYPSACSYPSGGCGSTKYWDTASCQCKLYSNYTPSTNTGSGSSGSGSGYTQPSSGNSYTPPSGYGSCPSGQYWNGSACAAPTGQSGSVPYTPPSQSQQQQSAPASQNPPPPQNQPAPQNPPPQEQPPAQPQQQSAPPPAENPPPPPGP